ncbi:MAG TPA: HAD-IC family P-type ATPase, partial [Nitrosomonas sp.]|nr:HAD-IC family P-type ATPase [Nitrosomonas sp.]
MEKNPEIAVYWSQPADSMMKSLGSNSQGLDPAIAADRLMHTGANRLKTNHFSGSTLQLFLNQFRSPLVLILIFAAIIALLVKDWLDALIVLMIVGMTAVLSFIQEHRATRAVEKLRQKIATRSTVLRGGQTLVVPSDTIVPGDIVVLSAGNLIPADGMLLEAKDFHVAQALLTGETFPVEKKPGISAPEASLVDRNNCIFMGTSVRSGYAKALIIQTGLTTAYGKIAETLSLRPPETEFERGLRHFGQLLVRIMVIMVIAILAINIVLQHPTIETVLFALALAVGLSPELLPAILTITLARGAKAMAAQGVIVKRLNAIENLGSMDVLCTDKTGTLTKGVVQLGQALDSLGQTSKLVLQLAYVNSRLQTGIINLLDEAIIVAGEQSNITLTGYQKLDEIP